MPGSAAHPAIDARSGKTERDGTDPAFNGSDMYPVRSNPLAEKSHEAVLAEPDRPFFLDLSLMSGFGGW